jgi:hypothetical protein
MRTFDVHSFAPTVRNKKVLWVMSNLHGILGGFFHQNSFGSDRSKQGFSATKTVGEYDFESRAERLVYFPLLFFSSSEPVLIFPIAKRITMFQWGWAEPKKLNNTDHLQYFWCQSKREVL